MFFGFCLFYCQLFIHHTYFCFKGPKDKTIFLIRNSKMLTCFLFLIYLCPVYYVFIYLSPSSRTWSSEEKITRLFSWLLCWFNYVLLKPPCRHLHSIWFWQVKQMLIALLCESEMKLADETIEIILDKVTCWTEL